MVPRPAILPSITSSLRTNSVTVLGHLDLIEFVELLYNGFRRSKDE